MSTAFPDRRWGSETSPLRRPLIWVSCTRPGSWLIKTMTPLDRRILLRTKGRFTALGPIGAPICLLTTTGVKSGQPRTTPLLYGREDEALIVVGSNFGQGHHPAWTGNLIAHPEAVVRIGGEAVSVNSELLSGEASRAAYQDMVAVARTYREYQSRTNRDIRVFRLTAQ